MIPKSIKLLWAIILIEVVALVLVLSISPACAEEQPINEMPFVEEPIVVQVGYPKTDILDSDIYWLARGMDAEDGINWSDEDILKIGTVIANRRDRSDFPNTYREVLLQDGQYQPFMGDYTIDKPDNHYIYLAMKIDAGYRSFDPDVVFQATFIQGPVADAVYDGYLGSTTYFCYG